MSRGGRIFLGTSMAIIGLGFFAFIPFTINILPNAGIPRDLTVSHGRA